MTDKTKKCTKCGEIKPASQFSRQIVSGEVRSRSWCKKCNAALAKEKYYNNGDVKKRSALWHKNNPDKLAATSRTRYMCAKKLCPNISPNVIEPFKCPVCGVAFGRQNKHIRQALKTAGRSGIFYCSTICYHISRTKAWREKSPYSQNIKRIRKEQNL